MSKSGAIIDQSGAYRYRLWRTFDSGNGIVAFIMLNPSTADAEQTDPTLTRCMGFAKSWGYRRLEVVNLFAYRATDPKELLKANDPIGPENDKYILEVVQSADMIVAAWGEKGKINRRNQQVVNILKPITDLHVLEMLKCGHPRHPLFAKSNIQPIKFK